MELQEFIAMKIALLLRAPGRVYQLNNFTSFAFDILDILSWFSLWDYLGEFILHKLISVEKL